MSKREACIRLLKKHLPEPYRTAAISQASKDESFFVKTKNIVEAIYIFQLWEDTKEGYDFWHNVKDHFWLPEDYPKLPPYPKNLLTKPKTMSKLKLVYYNEHKRATKTKPARKVYYFALENSQGELSEIHGYSNSGNRKRGLRRFQAARIKSGKKPYQIK